MTTLIQNSQTGYYLRAGGEWVVDQAEGRVFDSSLAALEYVLHNPTRNAVLVLKFADPAYDIRLHPFPAGDSPGRPLAMSASPKDGATGERSRRTFQPRFPAGDDLRIPAAGAGG